MNRASIAIACVLVSACAAGPRVDDPAFLAGTWKVLSAPSAKRNNWDFKVSIKPTQYQSVFQVILGACTTEILLFRVVKRKAVPVAVEELENGKELIAICTSRPIEHRKIAERTTQAFKSPATIRRYGRRLHFRYPGGAVLELLKQEEYRLPVVAR